MGATAARTERAWNVLQTVLDPEVPALSVCDLGIVRDVIDHGDALEVVLTPTYSGCPATEVIEQSVLAAIEAEGLGPARATLRRAPAWTTDWITEEVRRKLAAAGVAPPGPAPHGPVPLTLSSGPGTGGPRNEGGPRSTSGPGGSPAPAAVGCPLCGSADTELTAAFSGTACKALRRCLSCGEPFEQVKEL